MTDFNPRIITSSPPSVRSRPLFDQSPDSPPYTGVSTPFSDTSVVEKLSDQRSAGHRRSMQPLSSPIRADSQMRQMTTERQQARDRRAMRMRGGIDKMERQVAQLEQIQERRVLDSQATYHMLDPEKAAALEREQEEQEDDETLRFIEEYQWCEDELRREQELIEAMLARFSIS
ncbi:LAMI_0D05314g1_1 [Lachancea mirantina]|uniref:LAMI_0D05314g1_1 n=1 Tax=Lachancea mirantina TaxID=1230905 RepID=A0A1G4JB24_9SACH|nr:LAMI_0D05314g1_1 [Lachancea mirantina]